MARRRLISGPLIQVVAAPPETMPVLENLLPAGICIGTDAAAGGVLVPMRGTPVGGGGYQVGLVFYENAALPVAYESGGSVTGTLVGVAGFDGYPLVAVGVSATRRVLLYQDADEETRFRLAIFDADGLVVASDVYDGPALSEFASFSTNQVDGCVSGGLLYLLEPRDSAVSGASSSPYPALQRVTKRDLSTGAVLAEYVPADGGGAQVYYWGITPRSGGGVDLWLKTGSTWKRRPLDSSLSVAGSDTTLTGTATYQPARVRKRNGTGYTFCGLKVGSPGSADDAWYSADGVAASADIATGLAVPPGQFWLDIRSDDSLALGDWSLGSPGLYDFMVAILETDGDLLKP